MTMFFKTLLSPRKRLGGNNPFKWTRGQAAVELAMVTPILLLMLLAAVEMGRIYYVWVTAHDAARAAVEYGSQSVITASDNAGMQTAATNDAKDISGLTVTPTHYCECQDGSTITCGDAVCGAGNGPQIVYVSVTTKVTFKTLTNFPGIPSPFNLQATAIRRVQG